MIEFANPIFTVFVLVNLSSLVVLFWTWRAEDAGRIIYAVVFLLAGIINGWLGIFNPKIYLFFGENTLWSLYENFIYGLFDRHTSAFIVSIAIGQLLIAAGLFFRGKLWFIAIYGAIFFIWALLPLGIGAAFPATFFMLLTLIIIVRREDGNLEMEKLNQY